MKITLPAQIKHLRRYFHPLSKLARLRQQFLADHDVQDTALHTLIASPIPDLESRINQQNYIIVDFETTGLNPVSDDILSIGWVEMKGKYIELASAKEIYIKGAQAVKKETAVINHIVPEMLENGSTIIDAMAQFLTCAKGKVIIAHGCMVEQQFLDHFAQQHYGLPALPLVWLDTLQLEKYCVRHQTQSHQTDLRLSAIRQRYHLPEYNAHNALTDSIATAELFLALYNRLAKREKSAFGDIYKASL